MYFLNKAVKSGTYSANTNTLLCQGHPDKVAIIKEIILHNSDLSNTASVELSIYDASNSTRTPILNIDLTEDESLQFSTMINLTETQTFDMKNNTSTVNAYVSSIYVPAGS